LSGTGNSSAAEGERVSKHIWDFSQQGDLPPEVRMQLITNLWRESIVAKALSGERFDPFFKVTFPPLPKHVQRYDQLFNARVWLVGDE
jgi:hypothetical protein